MAQNRPFELCPRDGGLDWAEYQCLAKTAVDSGGVSLAAFLAGLESQER